MLFGKSKDKNLPPRSADPFLNAKQEWMERYGSYVSSAAHWRVVGVMALAVAGLALAGNLYQLRQNKITPYIVEVDKLGNAAAVKPLEAGGIIPRRLIQAEIVNTLTNWRTVTADVDLQKRLVGKLAAYVGGSAHGTIQEWYAANNPFERAKTELVSVDVSGLPLPVSSDSWRVSWRETTRNHQGGTMDVTTWEATVSVITVPPKNEAQILTNPGGIIITSLNFGKLLN